MSFNISYDRNLTIGLVDRQIDELSKYLFDNESSRMTANFKYSLNDLLTEEISIEKINANVSAGFHVCQIIRDQLFEILSDNRKYLSLGIAILEENCRRQVELLDYVVFDLLSYVTQHESLVFTDNIRRVKRSRTKTIVSNLVLETTKDLLLANKTIELFFNIPISMFLIRQYIDIKIKEILFGYKHHKKQMGAKRGLEMLVERGIISREQNRTFIKIVNLANGYVHQGNLPYYWVPFEIGSYLADVLGEKEIEKA